MAHPRLLIDTSIIIEHLRKQNRRMSVFYNIVETYDLYISTVVEFELHIGATDLQKRQDVQEILTWCTSLPLTSPIAEQAASIFRELRRTNQLIEIRDILIGATAMNHGLPLMTLNRKLFGRTAGLQLVSPPP